ncbi:FlaG/FlaF family flagellin (archaellin) [Methanomicrobium sp. W14]|uniref:zinc ribbon domain-containing protein n=1 Tax=Methanomicrobium sp. W14 TaxID=2817839 RepID=UPI001AE642CB|nr:zinc ribbon domain-containing protein [Methanomicrobium sp. W14]MBP2134471.1 FlaG/FlaF family flagellin (archaellin) [Methanomicrobium sp. W14]
MYRPELNPGEQIMMSSPGVIVKDVSFDAFLTNKRIIFAKKSDDIYERKELVFPLNLVKKYEPLADPSGTPTIEFSIQKPNGGLGELILKFAQTNDYRYSERDEWVDKLRRAVPASPDTQFQGRQDFQNQRKENIPPYGAPPGNIPGADRGFSNPPQHRPGFENQNQYNNRGEMPPRREPYSPPAMNRQPVESDRDPYGRNSGYNERERYGNMPPRGERMPPLAHGEKSPKKPVFCRYCGSSIPEGSLFCPSCGQKSESMQAAPQSGPSFPPAEDPYNRREPVRPPRRMPENTSRRDYSGGPSLADDPEFRGKGRSSRPQMPPDPYGPSSKKARKEQQKAYRDSEKQRMKEAKFAEKERKKAMKHGGRGYDSYGYRESRMPEGLPKIIGAVVAVVVILAVVFYAFNSGIIGGSGPVNPGKTTPSSGDSSSPGSYSPINTGDLNVSKSFGSWNIQVLHDGGWKGSYSVNGVTTTITDEDGDSTIYGYKQITIDNPSGTIEVTASKTVPGDTNELLVDIIDPKGHYAASERTNDDYGTVTASATV